MKYIVVLLALAACTGCSADLDRSDAEAEITAHLSNIKTYVTLDGGTHFEKSGRCNPDSTEQDGLVRYVPDGYEIPDGYKKTRVSCNYQQLYSQDLIVHAKLVPDTQEFQLTTIAGSAELISVTGIAQQDENNRRVEFQFKETYASDAFKQRLHRQDGIQTGAAQFRRYDDGWRMVSIDAGLSDSLTARPNGNGDLDAYMTWSNSIDFERALTEYRKEVEWRSAAQYQEMIKQTQYFEWGTLHLQTHPRWSPIIRFKGKWRAQCEPGVMVRSPNTPRDGTDCAALSGTHDWFQVRSDTSGIFSMCVTWSYDKANTIKCEMLNNSNVESYIDQWKLLSNPPRDQWFRLPLSNEWSPFRPNIPAFEERNDSWTQFAWRGCGDLCEFRDLNGSHDSNSRTVTNVQFKGQGFVELCYYTWRLGSGARDICRDPEPVSDNIEPAPVNPAVETTSVQAPRSSAWCKPIPEKSRSQVSIRALDGHGDVVTIEIEDNGAIVKGTGRISRGDIAGTSVLLRDPTLVMGKVPSWLTVSEGEQARLLVEFTNADGVEWAEDIPLPDYFWRALSGAATENQIIFRPVFEKSGGSRKGDPFDLNCTVQRDAAPDRFTAAGNSVRDAQTGLTWAAQDNGSDIDWNAAGNYCATLGVGWILPTVAELQGLYDSSGSLTQSCVANATCKVTPAIRLTSLWFWSGEPKGSSEAWGVSLADGTQPSSPVNNVYYWRALCVRRP